MVDPRFRAQRLAEQQHAAKIPSSSSAASASLAELILQATRELSAPQPSDVAKALDRAAEGADDAGAAKPATPRSNGGLGDDVF